MKDASAQAGTKASQVASDAYDTAADASQQAYKHASNAANQVSKSLHQQPDMAEKMMSLSVWLCINTQISSSGSVQHIALDEHPERSFSSTC